jgi:hypothetical protein
MKDAEKAMRNRAKDAWRSVKSGGLKHGTVSARLVRRKNWNGYLN